MTLQQAWFQQPLSSNLEVFRSQLGRLKVVDVGYIEDLDDSCSHAWVKTYTDRYYCEVISIGAFNDTVIQPTPGQYCLVFFPYTPTFITEDVTDTLQENYSLASGKCLPIGLCSGSTVAITSNGDSVDIDSPVYHAGFNKSSINIGSSDKSLCIDFEKGLASIGLGKNVFLQANSSGVEVKTGLTVDSATGNITKAKARINISAEGEVFIEASDTRLKSESLTLDGDVTITGSLDVAGGNFTVDKSN